MPSTNVRTLNTEGDLDPETHVSSTRDTLSVLQGMCRHDPLDLSVATAVRCLLVRKIE